MWNTCALLFINLKIWGICIAFTYYHGQIRMSRNNTPTRKWHHIKSVWAKTWPLFPTEKDPRPQCSSPLSVFVSMLHKHSHTTPWGQVNAMSYFHQSETRVGPFSCLRDWSNSNRRIVVVLGWATNRQSMWEDLIQWPQKSLRHLGDWS